VALSHQAFRYELDPTMRQRIALGRHCGAARWAWNWALKRRITQFEANEGKAKFTNAIEQHRELNAIKDDPETCWLREVSKCAPQEALRDLDRAFKNMRDAKKAGRKVGFPKFKKRGSGGSFRFTGSVRVESSRRVKLPIVGSVRTKEDTSKFKGRILSATVAEECGRWYISFAVEVDRPEPVTPSGPPVGVDLGLTTFATLSTGEKIEAPKPLKASLKKLRCVQRIVSRRQKGSNRRRKAVRRVARVHRRVRNVRRDFLHKLSSRLANQNCEVHLEDLHVKGMVRNRSLARAISDAGWAEFRTMLEYKCGWRGSKLVIHDRFFPSSKTCSGCGAVKSVLLLSERQYACSECGLVVDRDVNAAINLVKCTASSAGINARGDHGSGRTRKSPAKPGRRSENHTVSYLGTK
jgi:putative transposase